MWEPIEKTLRATAFHGSCLEDVLRQAASWLEEPRRRWDTVGDVVVSEDDDMGWWLTVYWYPAPESDRVERATKDNAA